MRIDMPIPYVRYIGGKSVQRGPMAQKTRPKPRKRATNVSLREDLLAEARELGVNVSTAAEIGLARAIATEREARWLRENRQAIESANAYVERHGLPLGHYRQF